MRDLPAEETKLRLRDVFISSCFSTSQYYERFGRGRAQPIDYMNVVAPSSSTPVRCSSDNEVGRMGERSTSARSERVHGLAASAASQALLRSP